MKKVLTLVLAIAVIATLAACNNNDNNNDNPVNKEPASTTIQEDCAAMPTPLPPTPTDIAEPRIEEQDTSINAKSCELQPLSSLQIIAEVKYHLENNDFTVAAHALCLIDTTRMQDIFDNSPELATEIGFIRNTIGFSEDTQAIEVIKEWDRTMTGTFGIRLTEGDY